MRDQQLRIAWMNTSRFPRRVFFPLLLAINCLAVLLSCVGALQEVCQSCYAYVLHACLCCCCLQRRFCVVSSVWLKHKMCAFLGMTTTAICRVAALHHCLDWTWIGVTEQLDSATRCPARLATCCKRSSIATPCVSHPKRCSHLASKRKMSTWFILGQRHG